MIVACNRQTLAQIKNPRLSEYAEMYVKIYEGFMSQVEQLGLEVDAEDDDPQVQELLEQIQRKGAVFRNDDKSIYLNEISPACVACQTGVGSATFFVSLQCHRTCFYCFNPNQEDYEFFQTHHRNVTDELRQVHTAGQKIKHLALTGGEPLLHKREAAEFFSYASDNFPEAYTRLYTTGDHADGATLQELARAGLDEIRISIRMHDLERGHRHVFDRVALAQQYVPRVMIEMPVLPNTFEVMKEVLVELERLKLYSINLLEFCFPLTNAQGFKSRGYRLKYHPFRILYDYWYAGGLPVAGSELECLRLVDFALDEQMAMGVHYCSLENKHTGQVYQQNFNQPKPKTAHFSTKDYFLKSAKVFGADIPSVVKQFNRAGYTDYSINRQYDYLEFHIDQMRLLSSLDIEVGICSSIIETRDKEQYVRELKVDFTSPTSFDREQDI